MSFTWLCRDVDDRVFLISNLQTESLISIPHGNDSTFDPAQGVSNIFFYKIFIKGCSESMVIVHFSEVKKLRKLKKERYQDKHYRCIDLR